MSPPAHQWIVWVTGMRYRDACVVLRLCLSEKLAGQFAECGLHFILQLMRQACVNVPGGLNAGQWQQQIRTLGGLHPRSVSCHAWAFAHGLQSARALSEALLNAASIASFALAEVTTFHMRKTVKG